MNGSNTWPYVDSYHPNESEEHLQLKNLAVYWLLQRGFELSEINDEYRVPDYSNGAHTDIHARQGGVEVFIECETRWHSLRNLSKGGLVPARRGEFVLVFKEDGIYQIIYESVTREDRHTGEEFTVNRLRPEYRGNLPMLDLRAFKE